MNGIPAPGSAPDASGAGATGPDSNGTAASASGTGTGAPGPGTTGTVPAPGATDPGTGGPSTAPGTADPGTADPGPGTPGPRTDHGPSASAEPPQALYVYALLPDPGTDTLPGPATGLDGRPLRLVGDTPGGPVALVHATAPAPYQGPDEDVRRWIVEHDRAVDAAWQLTGAVLPMTFNVLVRPEDGRSAEQRLRGWLAERHDELTARLEDLAGHAELRVEITLDREAAAVSNERARSLMADMAESSPGVRRLLAKRLEMARREASEQLADALYADTRRRLAAVSEDLQDRRRAVRDPGETDVLSVSLLVRQDGIETVGRVLAEIQDEQPAVRIRFLGPWPPYSFADLAQGPGGQGPGGQEPDEAPPGGAVPGLRPA